MTAAPNQIKQSRASARAALAAYRATGCHDEDDLTAIGDLIADLLHLADAIADERQGNGWVIRPGGLVERALSHFHAEQNEEAKR